jgi:hypothetical protein
MLREIAAAQEMLAPSWRSSWSVLPQVRPDSPPPRAVDLGESRFHACVAAHAREPARARHRRRLAGRQARRVARPDAPRSRCTAARSSILPPEERVAAVSIQRRATSTVEPHSVRELAAGYSSRPFPPSPSRPRTNCTSSSASCSAFRLPLTSVPVAHLDSESGPRMG